jgi:hypothetical protein
VFDEQSQQCFVCFHCFFDVFAFFRFCLHQPVQFLKSAKLIG